MTWASAVGTRGTSSRLRIGPSWQPASTTGLDCSTLTPQPHSCCGAMTWTPGAGGTPACGALPPTWGAAAATTGGSAASRCLPAQVRHCLSALLALHVSAVTAAPQMASSPYMSACHFSGMQLVGVQTGDVHAQIETDQMCVPAAGFQPPGMAGPPPPPGRGGNGGRGGPPASRGIEGDRWARGTALPPIPSGGRAMTLHRATNRYEVRPPPSSLPMAGRVCLCQRTAGWSSAVCAVHRQGEGA